MKKVLMFMLSFLFLAGVASNAQAGLLSALAPGATQNVTNEVVPVGTLLASQDVPFSSSAFSGMSHQAVYDVSGTGMLFVYSFENDSGSTDPITRMTTTSFNGWTTWTDASLVAHTAYSMDRTGSGGSIGFGFKNADPQIGDLDPGVEAGETSSVMWIQTNAPTYTIGKLSFIDGDVAHINGYAPNSVVPEPLSLSLLGSGLFGLMGLRRRKS